MENEDADIGVVITTHNYGHYLSACLDSVFAQTLPPQDVVVIDDASEDHTADIVARYEQVRYFRVDFKNGNRARNFGFERIKGAEIVFFDADNVMLPTCLAQLHRALAQDQTAAFAYGDRVNFGDATWHPHPMGHRVVGAFDKERLKRSNYIDLAALIRRAWFPKFDEGLKRYQDWDLWLHIVLKMGGYGCYVPAPVFRYRIHEQNLSKKEKGDRAKWAIRRKYRLGWGKWPFLRDSYRLYCFALWLKKCLNG